METRQTRGLQSFRRVDGWFAAHPDVIPASGSSAPALTGQVEALRNVVQRMTAQATEQKTQASQATLASRDEKSLRKDLRKLHMRSIVTVAKALRRKVPGTGVFKLPSSKMASEGLIHTAAAMHTTAATYEQVFVEHGLPADFLDQLQAAALSLKESVDARGVALSRRTGASTGLSSDLALGKEIVEMIDASLSHALKSDRVKLASWRQAKRVTVKGVVSNTIGADASTIVGGVLPTGGGDSAVTTRSGAGGGGDAVGSGDGLVVDGGVAGARGGDASASGGVGGASGGNTGGGRAVSTAAGEGSVDRSSADRAA